MLLKTFCSFLGVIALITFLSCTDYDSEEECEHRPVDCQTYPDTVGDITVHYTINSENPSVTVEIFKGDVDDGDLFTSVTRSSGSSYTYSSAPLGHYSARVVYDYGSLQIVAIDADSVDVESDEYCEGTCYTTIDADINCEFDKEAFDDFRSGDDAKCFIATAAYGSSFSAEVQILRNFRDKYLLQFSAGRKFVKLYYYFSPPVAEIIAESPNLRFLTRLLLTPLVMIIKYPFLIFLLFVPAIFLVFRKYAVNK